MPPGHLDLFDALSRFPDEGSLNALSSFKVDYLVVHSDSYPTGEWPAIERRLQVPPWPLRLVHVDAAGRVYALH